ncbi:MAG TPA: hypothetical protein VL048_11375 [Xanthobacteraceae bacterium]|nr:hypothetical protein [Xanthobacteraceae bacterium]
MSTAVNPKLIEIGLQHCETTPFERYAQTVFGTVMGPKFKPLGGHHDGGADGFIEAGLYEEVGRPVAFFQASKEITVEQKIKRTIDRLKEAGRDVKSLYYATSQAISHLDQMEFQLSERHSISIRIYDRNFFVQHGNHNPDAVAAFHQYLRPALAFLEGIASPTYPQQAPFQNARAICAFLAQEVEHRLGTTRTLEAVCDALILWALEDTDPDKNKLMSEEEIVAKVEGLIPSARHFLRGQIGPRISALTTKHAGTRTVNIYKKAERYCLPYDTRESLRQHTIEDESLKVEVTASFLSRLLACTDQNIFDTSLLEKTASLIHKTLELVFERQGLDVARHFLEEPAGESEFTTRSIADLAEEVLKASDVKTNLQPEILSAMKAILRVVFYSGEAIERTYCARLARTYMLLFTIRNTPEVIEYFNTMAKTFNLYLGSDLVIRALSEYYLAPENQMTVNAFRIIREAGSKLILTEVMLEEVHSHIWASHLEHRNVYAEIDGIVDRDLASQCDRILVRAYYYAKLDKNLSNRPTTWGAYLRNFLSVEKITSPLSQASMRSLRDTLCNRFGFEYETRDVTQAGVDQHELAALTEKIREMRHSHKSQEEILAENDALHILRVHKLRQEHEKSSGNPYGFKTWWITQETISGRAAAFLFPSRRDIRYIMRPEFLINYIAYNPTTDVVRESLRTIFPSLLGIRLGSRLEPHIVDTILQKIRAANEVDEARAKAMVAEHSDALKSNRMRNFLLKYTSPV